MAIPSRQTSIRSIVALLGVATALGLTGCGNFFQCEAKPSCPASGGSGGSGTSSGNYAYISNNVSNSNSVSVYDVSAGTPNALSNSPLSLGYVPNAMAITPNNSFMYVSDPAAQALYLYTVGSNGSLTNPNGNNIEEDDAASAMDITPDGKYLFTLDLTASGVVVNEYAIGSNGALSASSTPTLPLGVIATGGANVKVAPSGDFAVVTLGQQGDVIIPLSNELINTVNISAPTITFTTTGVGDFDVAIDSNDYVYFARTGMVAVYKVTADGGTVTPVSNTAANVKTGAGDRAILVAGTNVYTANISDGTISGFTSASGVLTPIAESPFIAPTDVTALGLDSTGKYLIAAGYNSNNGAQVYTIGTGGALTASSTVAPTSTTTGNPVVIAMTH
jgi:6-phosphogluconolactonase